MNIVIRIIGVVLLLVVAYAAYQLWLNQQPVPAEEVSRDSDSDSATTTPETSEPEWSRYEHDDYSFTFRYPSEASAMIENERVKVTYLGPDNTMGSEITDGFTTYVATEPGSDARAVANDQLDMQTEHATVVEDIEPYEGTVWSGYSYTLETGLGTDVTHLVLETDTSAVLTVSYSVMDPHEQGYADMVERILSSISLESGD